MINICNVHHKTQKWISPQLLYLSKNINTPYRIFSIVPDHVNPPDYHYSNSLGAGFRCPVSKFDIKERSTNNYINNEEFKGVYQYSYKLHQRIIEALFL